MLKYFNLLFMVVILGFGIGFLSYSGLFMSPQVFEAQSGPFLLLVKSQKGDYRQSGETIGALLKRLQSQGIQITTGVARYWDDPGQVRLENLRSEAGVLVNPSQQSAIQAVLDQDPKNDYQWVKIDEKKRPGASFPFRNQFSMAMAIYKVYPKLFQYLDEHALARGPTLEIFEEGETIRYWILDEKGN